MNRLREMGQAAGIRRIEDLAAAIDLSRTALTRIERQESALSWGNAQAIARVLGCRPHDLYVDVITPAHEREAADIARRLAEKSCASLDRWLAIGRDLVE